MLKQIELRTSRQVGRNSDAATFCFQQHEKRSFRSKRPLTPSPSTSKGLPSPTRVSSDGSKSGTKAAPTASVRDSILHVLQRFTNVLTGVPAPPGPHHHESTIRQRSRAPGDSTEGRQRERQGLHEQAGQRTSTSRSRFEAQVISPELGRTSSMPSYFATEKAGKMAPTPSGPSRTSRALSESKPFER